MHMDLKIWKNLVTCWEAWMWSSTPSQQLGDFVLSHSPTNKAKYMDDSVFQTIWLCHRLKIKEQLKSEIKNQIIDWAPRVNLRFLNSNWI